MGLIDFVNALAGLSTSFGLVSIWMITGISQSMNLDTRYIGLASTGFFLILDSCWESYFS